jgi:hypothetical protein
MGTFWVTDTLACLGTIPASMQEKLSALRTAMGNDGVHFSVQGRYNLFTNLAKTIYGLKNGSIGKPPNKAEAAASVVSGRKFYWRGFLSERGSTLRPQPYKRGGSAGRGRGRATTDPGPHRTTSRPIWVRGEAPEAGEAAAAADSSRFSEFFVSFFSLITCFCTRLSFTFRVNQQFKMILAA